MTVLDARRLVIASDLHLAPNLPGSPAFVEFLGYLLASEPSHLVIAGDLFDLLAAGDPSNEEVFNAEAAPRLLAETRDANRELFSRLTHLAERPGGSVTVLGGNHDVEICLPAVRLQIRALFGPHIQWLVHGEAVTFSVGSAKVVVEHGDLYDDWNRVDYGPLAVVGRLHSRGEAFKPPDPPPGSRVVAHFLNRLRTEHRWMEWVKPETALIPLLHTVLSPLERLRLMNLIGPYVEQTSRSLERRLLRVFGSGCTVRAGGAVPQRTLADWFHSTQREATRGRRDKGDAALAAKLSRIAAADGFFDPVAADPFVGELGRLPRFRDTQLVVLGHTHAAKALRLGPGLLYTNTGAWCPLVPLPRSDAGPTEWTQFLDALRSNSLRPRWRSTYAEVEVAEAGCTSRLNEWVGGASRTLAGWRWNQLTSWEPLE